MRAHLVQAIHSQHPRIPTISVWQLWG